MLVCYASCSSFSFPLHIFLPFSRLSLLPVRSHSCLPCCFVAPRRLATISCFFLLFFFPLPPPASHLRPVSPILPHLRTAQCVASIWANLFPSVPVSHATRLHCFILVSGRLIPAVYELVWSIYCHFLAISTQGRCILKLPPPAPLLPAPPRSAPPSPHSFVRYCPAPPRVIILPHS